MKQRSMWPLFVVVLALVLAACGGSSNGPAPYAVSGTIVDADGEPMAGVTLAFSNMTATAETDENGSWSQTGLKGSVTVTPAFDGYTFDPESARVSKAADDVHFTGAKNTDPEPDPDTEQPTGYTISGTVSDSDGNAIPNVKVRVAGADIAAMTVTTAADGTWEAKDVDGEVTVAPKHDDYDFNPVFLTLDTPTATADFVGTKKTATDGEQTYTASGTVTDEDGLPIAGVELHVEGPDIETTTATTDGNGAWGAKDLKGHVTIIPKHDDYSFNPVVLVLSTGTSTANFVAEKKPYAVSGTIEDEDGTPIAGVLVQFSDFGASVTTDGNGKWKSPILEGEVTVTPTHDDFDFFPPEAIVDKARNDVNFEGTSVFYALSGKVTDEGGNPVEDVTIEFSGTTDTATTDADGNWTSPMVRDVVTVTPVKAGYEFDPMERSVTEAASDVDFTMHEPYGLSGVLVDDDDEGIANAVVRFVYAGGEVETITDDDGAWEQHGLYGQVTIGPDDPAYAFSPAPYIVKTGGSGHNFTGELEACSSGSPDDELDPCELTRIKQVQKIQDNLKGHYALAANIDAYGTKQWNSGRGFVPLGIVDTNDPDASEMFQGTLDGRGYEIRGLYIDRPQESTVGLFALIGESGVIDDVHLVDGDVSGVNNVGAFAGNNFGTVTNSSGEASVSGAIGVGGLVGTNRGTIVDSDNLAIIPTINGHTLVGGIAGTNAGVIEQSSNEANVTASQHKVGGIAGVNLGDSSDGPAGRITDSTNRGNVRAHQYTAGGLVGINEGGIFDSQNFGDVRVSNSGVGGLAGSNSGTIETSDNLGGNVRAEGPPSNEPDLFGAGGLAGQNTGTIRSSYNIADVFGPSAVGGLVGRNEDEDALVEDSSNDGEVNSDGAYVGGSAGYNEGGRLIRVTNRGDFVDGKGDYVGGIAGMSTGTVQFAASRGAHVIGEGRVGGVIGENAGLVEYSFNTSEIWGKSDFVGGIVGFNRGEIDDAEILNSYNLGKVKGDGDEVGGVAGKAEQPSSILYTFNAGFIEAGANLGGLVAQNDGGRVLRSFFDETAAGTSQSDGGRAVSTEDMQTSETFTRVHWDFGSTWSIDEGTDYPDLIGNSRD